MILNILYIFINKFYQHMLSKMIFRGHSAQSEAGHKTYLLFFCVCVCVCGGGGGGGGGRKPVFSKISCKGLKSYKVTLTIGSGSVVQCALSYEEQINGRK